MHSLVIHETEADRLVVIWRFTVIWTLILIGGIFFLCSMMAFITSLLSLTLLRPSDPPDRARPDPTGGVIRGKRKRKRPPLWPVFLIPFVGSAMGAVLGLISGTVVGFVLSAVYSAGGFSMST